MKLDLAGKNRNILIYALRSVLILSAATLLFACGSGNVNDSASVPQGGQTANLAAMTPSAPLPAAPCSDAATVAAGMYHTVGLKSDGTVVATGYNGYGQLNVSLWTNIKSIAAGAYHTLGRKGDGTVATAGSNGNGQLNVTSWTNIKAVTAGAYHSVGLKEDGTVTAAGYNGYGQLNVSAWKSIKAIAAGTYHTLGLKEDGTVAAAGYNGYGQLNVSSWTNVKAIAAGTYHTVGLKEDGTVVAAGSNGYGQLNVSTWTNIKAIAAGAYHTVGLKEDGTVVAAGSSSYGQLNVSTWMNTKAVAAGAYHTAGLKDDGTAEAAGSNSNGQLNVSTLFTDIMPICAAAPTIQDATAPATTIVLSGTTGNNGWYVSDVQMTLTATDENGGSGVQGIHFSVDGTETVVQGSSAVHTIVGDGTHVVTWFAVDNAGNAETPHQMSVSIDKTPPSMPALSASPSVLWPPNHKMMDVLIGGYVADGASGIASTVITVTDEYGVYNMTGPGFGSGLSLESWFAAMNIDSRSATVAAVTVDNTGARSTETIVTVTDVLGTYKMAVPAYGNTIQLESWRKGSDMDGRTYTITAVTIDNAGNQATGTTTVIVPHDMR